MNEKVIEAIERLKRLAADDGEQAWDDLELLETELTQTKKALELANEGLAHYSARERWDYLRDSYGEVVGNPTLSRVYSHSTSHGYDKARETQKEIEKLLGGDR